MSIGKIICGTAGMNRQSSTVNFILMNRKVLIAGNCFPIHDARLTIHDPGTKCQKIGISNAACDTGIIVRILGFSIKRLILMINIRVYTANCSQPKR
jgi:hypothetical protein